MTESHLTRLAGPALGAAGIAALMISVAGRDLSLPGGSGWIDAYTFVDGARTLFQNPSELYAAAVPQLTTPQPLQVYIHPPAGLLAFLPLVPLGDAAGTRAAAGVWVGVDALLVVVAVLLMCRQARLDQFSGGALLLAVSPCAMAFDETYSGQVNGLLKPVAPLLLLSPFVRGRWRMGLLAVGVCVLSNAAFIPVIGLRETWFYAGTVLPFLAGFSALDLNNLSIANLSVLLLGGRPPYPSEAPITPLHLAGLARGLSLAVGVGAVLLCLRAMWRAGDDRWALALAMAAVPLMGATVWSPSYLLLSPLLVLVAARLTEGWRIGLIAGVGAGAAAVGIQVLLLSGSGVSGVQLIGVPDFETHQGLGVAFGVGRALATALLLWFASGWALLRVRRPRAGQRVVGGEERLPAAGGA